MQRVNISTSLPRETVLETVKNFNFVNDGVLFDEKKGKPVIKVNEKGEKIRITCELVGGASRDNGFLIGTYFSGRLTEKNGRTVLKGTVITDPVYHGFMLALIAFFVYRCITLGGFNIIPVCVSLFGFLLMKDEYRKQGIIKRYLYRAVRKAEAQGRAE